jgi:hypothetical protein
MKKKKKWSKPLEVEEHEVSWTKMKKMKFNMTYRKYESCGWEKSKLGFPKWNFCIYNRGKIIKILINTTGRIRSPAGRVNPPTTDPSKPVQ